MAERGLRVLAFASKRLDPGFHHDELEQNLIFLGLVGLEDLPASGSTRGNQKMSSGGNKSYHGDR